MRTISVPVIATVLGLCAALCLSQPVSTFSRAPVLADRNNDPRRVGKPPPTRPVRSNCANAAKVRAGSSIRTRSQEASILIPRTLGPNRVLWCSPIEGFSTFVIAELSAAIVGPAIPQLLTQVYNTMEDYINGSGNGPLIYEPNTAFELAGRDRLKIRVKNIPGQEMTLKVMQIAALTLYDYLSNKHWGEVAFEIYDNGRKVGEGVLGR